MRKIEATSWTGTALLALVASLTLASCQSTTASLTSAPVVTPAFFEDTVSATGRVLPRQWADLSFAMSGHVEQVLVVEGQQVTEGDLLAVLSVPELDAAYKQAETALEGARAELARLEAPARAEEVRTREVAVDAAEKAVAASEIAVDAARSNAVSAEAARSAAMASLTRLLAGPRAEELEIARQEVERAKALRYSAQGQRDAAGGRRDKPGYQAGSYESAEGQVLAAETVVTIAELNYRLLQEGARAEDVAAAQAAVDQAEAGLQAARTQVRAAEQQVAIAESQRAQAEAQLDLVRARAREVDLAVASAAVAQADAGVAAANVALEKAELRAPFSGSVAQLDLRPGEYVMMGVPVLSLGDLSSFHVETTDLDEIDIARVQVGASVDLTFDALPNVALAGEVTDIALKASSGAGGTAYKATIVFRETDDRLRWGMTAFTDIAAR